MALKQNQRLGETAWGRMSKVNAELFTLTYGAIVTQLIRDFEDIDLVNQQIEKMGYNIGIRIVDEFLAKSGVASCQTFRETADVIAKVAFKMFLGITTEVSNWNAESSAFSLIFFENALIDFVELPPQYSELHYSNVLVGVLKGALEMLQLEVEVKFVKDMLKGDDSNELRVELKSVLSNVMSDAYKES